MNIQPLPAQGRFQVVGQKPFPGDKVRVFFLGAQYCAFCAAERWALVSALERFGPLSGWGKESHNDGLDGFRAIPTYDLRNATYTSPYLHFTGKEILDHKGKPLQKLDADEQAIVNQYDKNGAWPFLFINGQYAQLGSGFSPALVQGPQFDTLRKEGISGAHTPAAHETANEADPIVRYLCQSTGGAPASSCKE